MRFATEGRDVIDGVTGRRAWFPTVEDAREGADWMNTGRSEIGDYVWVVTAGT